MRKFLKVTSKKLKSLLIKPLGDVFTQDGIEYTIQYNDRISGECIVSNTKIHDIEVVIYSKMQGVYCNG